MTSDDDGDAFMSRRVPDIIPDPSMVDRRRPVAESCRVDNTNAKKRSSPSSNPMSPSTLRSEPQPKRSKTDDSRSCGVLAREHLEYHEPLRDPDASTPARRMRASSVKPSSSPRKAASSVFPRAQSVPLGTENVVRAIDLISVPPSPRRSPSKGTVEIRRAQSIPPPDDDPMDVDASGADTLSLLHYTNPTQFPTPRANPVSHYTVNFATPSGPATPARAGSPFSSPLSPLTPSPPPSIMERFHQMQKHSLEARGPSTLQGPRRVTRSLSMKEQRVKDDVPIVIATPSLQPSLEPAVRPLSSACKPHPSKPVDSVAYKPKSSAFSRRSTSLSRPPADPGKLKQTSLNAFVKPKSMASTVRTSTSVGSSSNVLSSPSKIPLPASPSKRPSMMKPGSSSFSRVSNIASEDPRGISGRSLTNLSHALDKLVVPPPSRPNTSMGFVRTDSSGDEGTGEVGKGKEKTKDDTSLPLPSATFARPTASSLNRAATVTGFGSTATLKSRFRAGSTVAGMGKKRGVIGIFGKPGDRASRKPNLPVVAGSPVKGFGVTEDQIVGGSEVGKHKPKSDLSDAKAAEDDVFMSLDVSTSGAATPMTAVNNNVAIDLTAPIPADKGKQRALMFSALNPASSALHALSESLSTLPQTRTPPKPKAIGTRAGLRSSSTTAGKPSPSSSNTGSGEGDAQCSGRAGPSVASTEVSGGVKKSSLKILNRCVIFVDVRTEQGDDAGGLFVDMLKGLGAKIMTRLGRKCTHIVYKNGHPNTMTRYRLFNDPKPTVVGIAWVVECAEQRARVDEGRFKIDVDVINVAGSSNKHRRSMLPKHLIPSSPGPEFDVSMNMSSEADDDDVANGFSGSPLQDPDSSIRSREEDDLPPLERARRRRSILPGGQTRLIS